MKECCGSEIEKRSETKFNDLGADKSLITTFKVKGMDCADEIAAVEKSLNVFGVGSVQTNLMQETVTVTYSGSISEDRIIKLIEAAGLKVISGPRRSFYQEHLVRIWLISCSGLTLSVGLCFEWFNIEVSDFFKILLFLTSIVLSGIIIFPKAYKAILSFRLDMNVLMTIAVLGAVMIKEYSEAASVVFLFSLAELLEAMSVTRARKAIQEVLKLAPKEAILVNGNGDSTLVSVEGVSIDDLILVRPGDNVAMDGVVEEGTSFVNQATLTGESNPVEKKVGDQVFAGTLNGQNAIKVRVTKKFDDSKISKVMSMIESAQQDKAPTQRFVDKFSAIYTPAVLILAVLITVIPPIFFSGEWNEWFYKALVFLVIGCPCALVIATPVSIVSGLTSLAKRGVLVKGGVHLESLGKLKALALDKTGTITEGIPQVITHKLFHELPENECIKIAASLESMSSHPLALAMLRFAEAKNIKYQHPQNFSQHAGKGAEGLIGDHSYFVGNHKMAHELGVCSPAIEEYLDEVENQGLSVIVLGHKPHDGCKGEILAVFALGDKIRSDIDKTILEFHKVGIKHVSMLSGDNQKTVSAVAKKIGIDAAKGGLLPEDKVNEVKKMMGEYKFVGMVGDGVNDAPAMASASIGIAMGIVGSDTAIETADVALMKDDVTMLPSAIAHGKRVLQIIRFNISFAIAIKIVFFVLAFLGLSSLWMAVAADMGASLFVTFNALRLLWISE